MIATINTILRPAHLTVYSAGGLLLLALILAAVFSRRGRSAEDYRQTPPKRGSVWAAFLALGAVAAAFVWSQGKHTPSAPAAAPKPAPVHTEIIHQVVTKVVHSAPPVSGTDIVLILLFCLLATVALFAIRTGRN